jgi:hypothetical protein
VAARRKAGAEDVQGLVGKTEMHKADAEAVKGAAEEQVRHIDITRKAAKRKADAEPAERAAGEELRRGKTAKLKVNAEVVKVKRATEEKAGQR